MAARNYDISLDSIIKLKKTMGKNSKIATEMNKKPNSNYTRNNHKRQQYKKPQQLRTGRFKIERKTKIPQRGNIKNRVTLDSSKLSSRQNNVNGIKNKSIVKSVQQSEQGKEIKLFTKHFDARSKLSSRVSSSPKKKKGKTSKEIVSLSRGIAKKALDDVRSNMKSSAVNQRRDLISKKERIQPKIFNKPQNTERESTFTGKSIQIKAKNISPIKERESHLRGNSLSVVTKNISKKTAQSKKNYNFPSRPIVSNKSKLPHDSCTDPVVTKKPIPAKMIISNLHQSVTQEDIKELFGAIGKLKDARLKNLGTAEVIYVDSEDAFQAYNKYNSRNLDGQPMILKITTVEESSMSPSIARSSTQYGSESVPSVQSHQYSKLPRSIYDHSALTQGNYNEVSSIPSGSGKPVVFTVRL